MKTVLRIEKATRKRKILVAEDEAINRMMLGRILGNEYDVIYAEDGQKALDIIKAEYETISIILLDLVMPVMDGYELIEILMNDKHFKNIPIIVMTSDKTAEIRTLQLGAVDFIPKPYDMPEVIRARISRSIKLAEESRLLTAVEDDPLTGLYNKEFFLQYAGDLDMYHPNLDTDTAVININRFHLINELYGSKTGDIVLNSVAECLRLVLRKNIGLACRSHNDTFYVYLAHQDDYDFLCKRMTEELEAVSGIPDVSVRVGVYKNCDKSLSISKRIDMATIACNLCRGSYTTSYASYDSEMHERELFCEKLIRDTDKALRQGQFQVYYQPKYNIEEDEPELVSAEALIRWTHPEHGRISPGVFIPLFEENGLIKKVDHFVWNQAAAQIAKWKKDFGVTIPISVNVSRVDMFDPTLESVLLKIVKSNGISTSDLMLEVTESAYTGNNAQILSVVNKLRSDGFRIEMDDFGSGYSSLNMLSSLPIDILKLDIGFVRKVCESEKDKRMVAIILEIAEFLNVPVVAEGVEKREQYLLLKNMGCSIIQGYYFSKPEPPEELEGKISQAAKIKLSRESAV